MLWNWDKNLNNNNNKFLKNHKITYKLFYGLLKLGKMGLVNLVLTNNFS